MYDVAGDYEHSIGGPNGLVNGGCPSCGKPLLLFLTLDTGDPRLGWLSHEPRLMKFCYCMRCELCSDLFAYRQQGATRIETIVAHKGDTHFPEWQEGVGFEVIPHRKFELEPTGRRCQALADCLNAESDLSPDEEREFSVLSGNRGIPRQTNQIGGRPYVASAQPYPLCPACCPDAANREKYRVFMQRGLPQYVEELQQYRMTPIASIGNDDRFGLRLTFDGATILFYACTTCGTTAAYHYVT